MLSTQLSKLATLTPCAYSLMAHAHYSCQGSNQAPTAALLTSFYFTVFPVLEVYLLYFTCMSDLPAHVYMHLMCAWCLHKSEMGVGFPGMGVMDDGCEPPRGCRELNPGLLQKQQVFSATEPAHQPYYLLLRSLVSSLFSPPLPQVSQGGQNRPILKRYFPYFSWLLKSKTTNLFENLGKEPSPTFLSFWEEPDR